MMPLTSASTLLIRWTTWLERACFWAGFHRQRRPDHVALVASWAKADYKAWRAATFQ
jgi:hypothetical protein